MKPTDILFYTVYGGMLLAAADVLVGMGLPDGASHFASAIGGAVVLATIWAVTNYRKRGEGRLLTLTPEELLGTFKNQTQLKVEALKKSYIGKTITATDRISAISSAVTSVDLPFMRKTLVGLESSPVRSLFHGVSWRRELENYDLGQMVSITGRIEFIEDGAIFLKRCKIEKVPPSATKTGGPPTPTPTPPIVLPSKLWDLLHEVASKEGLDFEGPLAGENGEDLEALKDLRLIYMDIGYSRGFPQYTNVRLTEAGRAILRID